MNHCKGLILSLLLIVSFLSFSQTKDSVKVAYHSPSRALLLSTLCPGLGQIYNKQVWKVPVIYVGMGVAIYYGTYNYNRANKFKKEYQLRNSGTLEGRRAEYANYPDESIYNLYNAYDKNFQLCIIAASAVYIMNMIDALVYAHLFSYDISDNLSMTIVPYSFPTINAYSGLSTNFGVSMSLRF